MEKLKVIFSLKTNSFFIIINHSFRFAQGTKRNETVALKPILFYKYTIEIAGNYKSRGGDCAASLGADRIIICVDCPFKHK